MENLSERRNSSPYEFVFSWSIAFLIAYLLLVYALRLLATGADGFWTDFCYYYFRAGARLTDTLHLSGASPVSTEAVARQDDHWAEFGRELTFLTSALCLTFVIALIVKLIRRTRVNRVMDRLLGPATLFAAPACYAAALSVTRTLPDNTFTFGDTGIPAWLTVLLTEIVILMALMQKNQDRGKVAWLCPALLSIHFLVWMSILWQGLGAISILELSLLPCTLPISVLAWWGQRRRRGSHSDGRSSRALSQWNIAAVSICVTILAYLWFPHFHQSMAPQRDLSALVLELSRGPCFGICATYQLVAHGDDRRVEYAGYDRVRGRRAVTSTVSEAQLRKVLQKLDALNFFDIEDRAFAWCFDSASLGISVSLAGKTKRVASDSYCTGAPSGIQSQFVRAFAEIERVLPRPTD